MLKADSEGGTLNEAGIFTMLRVMLIQGEELVLEELAALLHKIGGIEIVGQYGNALRALETMESPAAPAIDLVFLDIMMPGIDGLSAARYFKKRDERIEIVFVTAYPQFSIDAFELQALDYLLRPINRERLEKMLERVKYKWNKRQ
ncbi:LytR/AlgR family response regulator transcription factor [Paenibacillus eucommiae]|uniref:DNA-binding LytR/AlgR family response regulator n=1 Tax=Paenibacillus eucommiae TaxID=1355755 RepID=A0ABS4J507_9BACL|nr:response regulator [Paenibacillus eucommiae]MBP1994908.1 DNA-binding LytR/AlgR family response regulator [Paenibacillus eucommiae]